MNRFNKSILMRPLFLVLVVFFATICKVQAGKFVSWNNTSIYIHPEKLTLKWAKVICHKNLHGLLPRLNSYAEKNSFISILQKNVPSIDKLWLEMNPKSTINETAYCFKGACCNPVLSIHHRALGHMECHSTLTVVCLIPTSSINALLLSMRNTLANNSSHFTFSVDVDPLFVLNEHEVDPQNEQLKRQLISLETLNTILTCFLAVTALCIFGRVLYASNFFLWVQDKYVQWQSHSYTVNPRDPSNQVDESHEVEVRMEENISLDPQQFRVI